MPALREIITRRNFHHLMPLLNAIELCNENQVIDIAIMGQFKSGKSSLINHLVGKEILPTGVIPVTAVLTRLQYGDTPNGRIFFKDGKQKDISISELPAYVVESQNPGNIKGVDYAEVYIPELAEFKHLRIIDTPGVGSIFSHNTENTHNWLVRTGIAIIANSAERPLSAEDKSLVEAVKQFAPRVIIVITKSDLFKPEELQQIRQFMLQGLSHTGILADDIFSYSSIKDGARYRQNIIEKVFKPMENNASTTGIEIARHKMKTLAYELKTLLDLTLKAALNTEEENHEIYELINEGHTNYRYLLHQLELITRDIHRSAHKISEESLLPYNKTTAIEISREFDAIYPSIHGNLYKTARWFESWLNHVLTEKIKKILEIQIPKFEEFHQEIRNQYILFFETYISKFHAKVEMATGIKLPHRQMVIETPQELHPDIHVNYTFETHLDLLWFLIPMRIFKSSFVNKFKEMIEDETEKNIRRQANGMAELLQSLSNSYKALTIQNIDNQFQTIKKILETREPDIELIKKDLDTTFGLIEKYAETKNGLHRPPC